jgi:hypothetical protein
MTTTHLGILVVVPQLQRVLDLLQGPERVRAQQAVLVQAAKLDGCLKDTIKWTYPYTRPFLNFLKILIVTFLQHH